MIKSFCLYLFFLVFTTTLTAQASRQRKIDSLYALLQTNSSQDTNRVRLMNNYARMIRYDSSDKAMLYADEGLSIARNLNDDYWTGQCLYSKGMIYFKLNDNKKAIAYFDSAIAVFEQLQKYPLLTAALNFKAEVYHNLSDYSHAIDIFHEVIRYSQKTTNPMEEGVAYGNIGNIYSNLEMHPESITYYRKAGRTFSIIKDSMLMGLVLHNIGFAYQNLYEFDSAKNHYDTAISFFTSLGRQDAISMSSGGLGLVLGFKGKYKEGLLLIDSAIASTERRKDKRFYAVHNISAARVVLEAAKNNFGNGYTYQKALGYAEKGLNTAREIAEINLQTLALKFLAEIYNGVGNYPKAYNTLQEYIQVRDSISGANRKQEIAIKEVQFENEKQKVLLEEKHTADLNRQATVRNFFIAIAGLIALASVLLFAAYKRKRDAKAMQREAELNAEVSSIEMKALRSQMNPHFIFNSLNSIADYMTKNNTQLADEYLTKFSKLMRLILENSEKKEVPLADDLKALELYMQLEALRLDKKFTYEIKVDETIDRNNTMIPPLLLQPFVENSIWHGIAKKADGGKVLIMIVPDKDGMINCIVEDNGIGRKLSQKQTIPGEHQSMGVKITRERIDVLNRIKKSNARIVYTDLPQGTKVHIQLPAVLNF